MPPVEAKVYEIYSEYNPAKLMDVPYILDKYKNQELLLLKNLRIKYHIGMEEEESEIYTIFETFDRTRMGDATALLTEYVT